MTTCVVRSRGSGFASCGRACSIDASGSSASRLGAWAAFVAEERTFDAPAPTHGCEPAERHQRRDDGIDLGDFDPGAAAEWALCFREFEQEDDRADQIAQQAGGEGDAARSLANGVAEECDREYDERDAVGDRPTDRAEPGVRLWSHERVLP